MMSHKYAAKKEGLGTLKFPRIACWLEDHESEARNAQRVS